VVYRRGVVFKISFGAVAYVESESLGDTYQVSRLDLGSSRLAGYALVDATLKRLCVVPKPELG
jgi:hypothetical protein